MQYIKAKDGTRLATYILNPHADKCIILVHGWPLNHDMWEYQLFTLIEDGYCVITYDIRGFGQSECSAKGYDYDTFADDLHMIASHVLEHLKFKEFDLAGFSMGGAICARYMAKYKGHGVHKLCFVDAAIPSYCKTENNPAGQSIPDTNRLIAIGKEDKAELNDIFGDMFFYSDVSDAFRDYMFNMSNTSSLIGEIGSLIALRDEDCYNDLKDINVHTAIFHGYDDDICKYEMANIVNDVIVGSHMYSYENAGHGMFFEKQKEFNQDLIEFLNG